MTNKRIRKKWRKAAMERGSRQVARAAALLALSEAVGRLSGSGAAMLAATVKARGQFELLNGAATVAKGMALR
jgi:hypothetical protein